MITVYALKSLINGIIYVGMCKDLEVRLLEHNRGKNKSTKAYRPWVELYSELQPDWPSAREREKKLKSGAGKEFLKSLVR